ncbi:microfibril-associated glycoprotein 4-like [Dendronephthya gigantea]|uniref:microfibril-associated glycoprotein 4-like n=1 Tax=Dendronephthya gigantea TaxID=151771 RepID=UPI00106A5D43|nr:microfibril-associated glycoprotein 4-like [Dendronephthya gigantea]
MALPVPVDQNRGILSSLVLNIYVAYLQRFRLNAPVVKTNVVSEWIDCVMECATEICCRSINFKKKWTSKNDSNCEMLHNVVYNTSERLLEKNSSYDYVYLVNPQKEFNATCFVNTFDEIIAGYVCADIYHKGIKDSGIYEIDPDGKGSFKVFCDMTTSGGGWTVFQRRLDGSVDFYRGWQDYKQGFGNLSGEYWLGLDKIHMMTNILENELRIDMEDTSGNTTYAHYDSFNVSSENEKYKLNVGGYHGKAGDNLSYNDGMAFSTKDSDNDINLERNCAVDCKGAWWYRGCYHANLNGFNYYGAHTLFGDGINWGNAQYSLTSTSMKMRPHKSRWSLKAKTKPNIEVSWKRKPIAQIPRDDSHLKRQQVQSCSSSLVAEMNRLVSNS